MNELSKEVEKVADNLRRSAVAAANMLDMRTMMLLSRDQAESAINAATENMRAAFAEDGISELGVEIYTKAYRDRLWERWGLSRIDRALFGGG